MKWMTDFIDQLGLANRCSHADLTGSFEPVIKDRLQAASLAWDFLARGGSPYPRAPVFCPNCKKETIHQAKVEDPLLVPLVCRSCGRQNPFPLRLVFGSIFAAKRALAPTDELGATGARGLKRAFKQAMPELWRRLNQVQYEYLPSDYTTPATAFSLWAPWRPA